MCLELVRQILWAGDGVEDDHRPRAVRQGANGMDSSEQRLLRPIAEKDKGDALARFVLPMFLVLFPIV
jgi:hypothetical protein